LRNEGFKCFGWTYRWCLLRLFDRFSIRRK
jgi:hypothetical protein